MHSTSSSSYGDKPVIVFSDVRKTFRLKHAHSLKETFIAAIKRKEIVTSFNAVSGLSFEVPKGQSVALMGRNGSGKSTTLKMLSGVMDPDDGWIRTRGRIAGLLEVGAGFHPDLTGRENVYLNAAILGMSKQETDERFDSILEFSELGDFIDTEVKRYSSGMYARLGFSVAVHTELDTLLVDEVLSVGDAQFRKKCETRMLELQESGKTMFIVSHNVNQVKKLCQRGIVLDRGVVVYDGPIDEAAKVLQGQGVADTEFKVVGPIRKHFDEYPGKFGAPIGNQVEVNENGGGWYQEFERGIITHGCALPESSRTNWLGNGIFIVAYKARGGPSGAWGFLAGEPSGSFEDGGTRSLTMQHGTASFTVENGIEFVENA